MKYKKVTGNNKPSILELNDYTNMVYVRKDVEKIYWTDTFGNQVSQWTWLEAKIPLDEFEKYAKLLIFENSSSMIDNQIVMMEAIADIWEETLQ